jgi:hypothetical protein
VAEGYFHPTEVTTVDNDLGSSSEGLYPNFDSQSSMPTEISGESSFETTRYGNSECDDALMGKMVGDITFPLTVPSTENHSNTSYNDPDVDNREKEFSRLEPSVDLSIEQKDWGALESLDDYNNNITDDVPTTSGSEFSENKIDLISSSANVSDINPDTSFNLSMEERVANFIQNGDLDPVEGKSNM